MAIPKALRENCPRAVSSPPVWLLPGEGKYESGTVKKASCRSKMVKWEVLGAMLEKRR